MKQLHKQHWLIICMILVMIVSASGMDVTSLPQGHSPEFSANGSLIQTTTVQNSSLELCSPELLGVRLIQPRLSNARPVTLRQDGRQQHDLTLLYTIAVLSICTLYSDKFLLIFTIIAKSILLRNLSFCTSYRLKVVRRKMIKAIAF